jgi:hypothetical protein
VKENFSNLGAIVDGTEIRVPRPSDNELQKTVYPKKKHQHSVTVLLICTPRGHLILHPIHKLEQATNVIGTL